MLIDSAFQIVRNGVTHLRLERRIHTLSKSGKGTRRISLYSPISSQGFGTKADQLYLEIVNWYGTTQRVERRTTTRKNLHEMISLYDTMLIENFVSISDATTEDFDDLVAFAEGKRNVRNKYYTLASRDYMPEFMTRDSFSGVVEKPDVFVLILRKDGSVVGFTIAVIETVFDDIRDFYDKRLVIKDIEIDGQYRVFNFEYYVVERLRRICHERQLRYLNVEISNDRYLMIHHFRQAGFGDMTFRGELDFHNSSW